MFQMLKVATSVTILNAKYTLTEIQDDRVPLAPLPEVKDEYFGTVIGAMILMILVWIAAIYLLSCYKYRVRIRQLSRTDEVYCGWNLSRLRDTAIELELQEAEQIVRDMQEIFRKNVQEAETF